MKLLISLLLILLPAAACAVTFEELGNRIKEPMTPRTSQGVVRSIDMVERSIVVSGYEYLVGPPTIKPAIKVSLYGTTAGAFELLSPGMTVEVQYLDFGDARVAFVITQLAPDADVEH